MFRQWLVAAAMLVAAGCSGMGHNDGVNTDKATTEKPTSTELAAYAGNQKYPTDAQPKDTLRAASIVNRERGYIKIYNFDRQPIRNADIWVNKAYVQHISGIAPQSSVIIRFTDLYNGLGKSFSSQSDPVSTVEVRSGSDLYTLEGPATE